MPNNLNDDGSFKDRTFTQVKGIEYPRPELGKETYRQYYTRVAALKIQGFHLGDLSQSDYVRYCDGQGFNETNADEIME